MKIKIHNDGKEKRHSFECHKNIDVPYSEFGNSYISVDCYGEDEKGVISNLLLFLKHVETCIKSEIEQIESGDITIEYVDFMGNPLKH